MTLCGYKNGKAYDGKSEKVGKKEKGHSIKTTTKHKNYEG